MQKEFKQAVSIKCQHIPAEAQSAWEYVKNELLEAADEIRVEMIWCWSNDVDNAVKEKRKSWQQCKNGGTKQEYPKAQKVATTAV